MKTKNWLKIAALGAITLSTVSAFATATPTPNQPVAASNQVTPNAPSAPIIIPPPPTFKAHGWVLMDANSGKVLAEKNMNTKMQPASLTKLMTLYITFEALKRGQIKLDNKVRISKDAWSTGGSRMFLKLGSHVPLQDLIEGVIVASGNDACVAISEYIAGTQNSFAHLMNQTAKSLGMNNTHYVDPTGLPRPGHVSTPYDLALLTKAVINNYPSYYHFFKQKWISWNNIKQPNRNRLLWRDQYVDGLKTGHTKEAGYCLISSGVRHGTRLISVMMGTPTDSARINDSQALLNWGFRFYNTHKIFDAEKALTTPRVWLGEEKNIPFGLTKDMFVTTPLGQIKNVKATIVMNQKQLRAPITKGQIYGEVNITLNGKLLAKAPLIALDNDPKGSLWSRLTDHVELFFKGLVNKV